MPGAMVASKNRALTRRLEKEDYDHVSGICLFDHARPLAMGAQVWRLATPLWHCPEPGSPEKDVNWILN